MQVQLRRNKIFLIAQNDAEVAFLEDTMGFTGKENETVVVRGGCDNLVEGSKVKTPKNYFSIHPVDDA